MATRSARVIGTLALLASALSIGVNETHLLRAQRSLEDGRRRARALAKPELDARNDGQLVLFAGAITTNAVVLDSAGHALANTRSPIVMDPEFGIAVRGVRLARTVEMLQWVETAHTTTRHTTDEDDHADERERVYLYDLRWRADRVDSTQFDDQSYANPWEHGVPWRFESKVTQASDVVVGDFPLSDALLDQIKRCDTVALDAASRRTMHNVLDQRLGEDWSARSALPNVTLDDDEKHFFVHPSRDGAAARGHEQTHAAPALGDLRVSFTVTPAYAVTVCAKQEQQTLVPFATSASESIYLLEDGVHSVTDLFDLKTDAKFRENRFLRLFSSVVGFIGFLTLHPALVARVRHLSRVPAPAVAASLSCSLTFSVAAACWVSARLVYAAAMLAGGAVPTLAVLGYVRLVERLKQA